MSALRTATIPTPRDVTAVIAPLLRRHRRAVAAGLFALAALSMARTLAQDARPATIDVAIAAKAIAAGSVIDAGDLATVQFPEEAAPAALLNTAALIGRRAAGPIPAGDPVTPSRLVGPDLLDPGDGSVIAPVRLSDDRAASLLRPGDIVDVLAAQQSTIGSSATTQAETAVEGARVLAVPGTQTDGGSLLGGGRNDGGGLILLAVDDDAAARLAGAAANARLSVVIRSP